MATASGLQGEPQYKHNYMTLVITEGIPWQDNILGNGSIQFQTPTWNLITPQEAEEIVEKLLVWVKGDGMTLGTLFFYILTLFRTSLAWNTR